MYGMSSRKFDPWMLILGIASIIIGFLIPRYPKASLLTLAFLVGVFIFIEGLIKLGERKIIRNFHSETGWLTFSAILDLIFGIICFLIPAVGLSYLWMMFSITFILDSFFELWASRLIPSSRRNYYWVDVVLGVVGIILGVILLFNPMYALSTILFLIAFYFIFFGVLQVIKSF